MKFAHVFFTVAVFFGFLPANFAQEPTVLRHGGSVQTVKFSPVDNSLIASANDNGTIKLWNLQDDTVTTLRGHSRKIHSVAFSPDGQRLVSGSDDWTFRLWDVQAGAHIATLEHIIGRNRSAVIEVAFSPDGQLLATAGLNVKLWKVSTQNEIETLQHNDWVVALAFSPNGELLATGDNQGNVNIWDIQERKVIAKLEGDTVRVDTLVFSPDGRTLASAGYHGLIKLWAVSDWALLGTLQNRGTVYTLDFSPDGKALASTGHGTVTLWSVENGEEIASLMGHSAWVYGAAFSPDGKTLASAGDDGLVRVQNIESHLQTLQQRETVRLIYFLPVNRQPQRDIDTKLDTLMRDVQEFYTEQMNAHGFGRKTFTFETDATGKALVHHVNGRFTDGYYNNETLDKVIEEIEDRFNLSTNLYLISIDTGSEKIDVQWCGRGGIHGTTGGVAIVPASGSCFVGENGIKTAAHELGHAFGLDHDFRDDAYLMSYGLDPNQLSYCAAEWLNVHGYFNNHQTSFNEPTTMTMHTPIALSPNATRLRFEVRDTDGLHQALLIMPTDTSDPADGVKLHSCKALNGEIKQVEFTVAPTTEVTLRVMDVNGNFTQETYPLTPSDMAHVDVNMDGIIDVADLVLVASDFGTTAVRGAIPNPDVNNDGFVNREDLLLVVEVLESDESILMVPTSTTTISLSPAIVSSPAIGQQLTFSVKIADAENIAGYQATVSYNTSALRYVESANGDYLPSGAFFVPPVAEGNTVTLAASSLAGESNGDGTLATLTFEIVAIKASTVRLTNVLLTDGSGGSSVPEIENAEITEPPQLPADINQDGVVNIIDLTLVASNFGKTGSNDTDVNGDGVVNIIDLTLVAAAFGNTAAAPELWSRDLEIAPTRAAVEQWLSEARRLNLTDPTFQRGISVLGQLLAALTPKETALLPNYPNPFNPETWIPYQLAKSTEVTLTIYAVDGQVVRTLSLGHHPAGVYQSRSRAAYWDGRNQLGEPVSSGVYFYTLTAGDFSATRKMSITK
ncbi:hypothetical protein C6499_21800 [Candidatus Poribacteria bacterium]|nr:MAG: hypothetical protein C6499_21800 [Candidatus Poribacteria bacterium]